MENITNVEEYVIAAGTIIDLGLHKVSAPEHGIARADGVEYRLVVILDEDYPLLQVIRECREWTTTDQNKRRCSVKPKDETEEQLESRGALARARIADTAKEQAENGFVEILVSPKTKRTRSKRKVTVNTVIADIGGMSQEAKEELLALLKI